MSEGKQMSRFELAVSTAALIEQEVRRQLRGESLSDAEFRGRIANATRIYSALLIAESQK